MGRRDELIRCLAARFRRLHGGKDGRNDVFILYRIRRCCCGMLGFYRGAVMVFRRTAAAGHIWFLSRGGPPQWTRDIFWRRCRPGGTLGGCAAAGFSRYTSAALVWFAPLLPRSFRVFPANGERGGCFPGLPRPAGSTPLARCWLIRPWIGSHCTSLVPAAVSCFSFGG